MTIPYGGLTVAANTTASIAGGVAAKYTEGWASHSVSRRGALDVTPDADNSRLTLKPGIYLVVGNLSIEFEDISGTSGDDAGRAELKIYAAGAAVGGAVGEFDMQDSDRPQTVTVIDHVEITAAQEAAGTNYVELYLDATDASGNDVTVKSGKLLAYRLN